jgi:quercetin dioxygenase-like cupin family protein
MKKKNRLAVTIAVIGLTVLILTGSAQAQPAGSARTELQRHDLSIPGREMIQVRVDINAGAVFPRHNHHGEEVVYVLEGSFEYRIDGQPAVILKAGDVLFIPAGAIHTVKNIGKTKGSELATYIVEKGKPLVEIAK